MRDTLHMIGTQRQPVRQMTTQHTPDRNRSQTDPAEHLSPGFPSAAPVHQRRDVAAGGDHVGGGVYQPHPQVLLMPHRPIGETSQHRRQHADHPGTHQQPRGPLLPWDEVEQRSRDPRTDRHLHRHRVQRMTQRNPMQDVAQALRADHRVDSTADPVDYRVQPRSILQPGDRTEQRK